MRDSSPGTVQPPPTAPPPTRVVTITCSVHPAHKKLIRPTVFSKTAGAPNAGGSLQKKPRRPPQHWVQLCAREGGLLRVLIRPEMHALLYSTRNDDPDPKSYSTSQIPPVEVFKANTIIATWLKNRVNYFRSPRCPIGLPWWLSGKVSACNARDLDSIPGSGRSLGKRNGNPLQYSCLGNSTGQRNLVGCSPWGHKESDTINKSIL